jgi:hypothetical protein
LLLSAVGNEPDAIADAELAIRTLGETPETTLMAAIILSNGDIVASRRYLLRSTMLANRDAAALVAYTYAEPGTEPPAGLNLPDLPHESGIVPPLAQRSINVVAPASATTIDEVFQGDAKARVYYSHTALREPPRTMFIPGAWSELVSPAVLLVLQTREQ